MVNISESTSFLDGARSVGGILGNNISAFSDFITSILSFLLTNLITFTTILILLPYWILLFLTHLPVFIIWIEGILTAMAYFNGKKTFYIMLNLWGHYNISFGKVLIKSFCSSLKFTINTIIKVINMVMKFIFGSIEAIPVIQ